MLHPLLSEDFNEDDLHSASDDIEIGIKHSEDETPDLLIMEKEIIRESAFAQ